MSAFVDSNRKYVNHKLHIEFFLIFPFHNNFRLLNTANIDYGRKVPMLERVLIPNIGRMRASFHIVYIFLLRISKRIDWALSVGMSVCLSFCVSIHLSVFQYVCMNAVILAVIKGRSIKFGMKVAVYLAQIKFIPKCTYSLCKSIISDC